MTTYRQYLEGNTNIKLDSDFVLGFKIYSEDERDVKRFALDKSNNAYMTDWSNNDQDWDRPAHNWRKCEMRDIPPTAIYVGQYDRPRIG